MKNPFSQSISKEPISKKSTSNKSASKNQKIKKTISPLIFFTLLIAVFMVASLMSVSAITPEEIKEAKGLIDSKTDCKGLSDSQLEIVGEYLMEQMHPGDAHEQMHSMMGIAEGSAEEKEYHITMAKSMYCKEGPMMDMENKKSGMMGMENKKSGMTDMNEMMGCAQMMNSGNMMNMKAPGMMGNQGNWNPAHSAYVNVLIALCFILLVGLIVLVYSWIFKLWK